MHPSGEIHKPWPVFNAGVEEEREVKRGSRSLGEMTSRWPQTAASSETECLGCGGGGQVWNSPGA